MKNLVSLQLKTTNNFNKNLKKLLKQVNSIEQNSIIVAPELVLTGYAYDHFKKALKVTKKAIKKLKKASKNQTIILTMITKNKGKIYNTLFVFHNKKIIHTQSKHHLFVLNDEKKHFTSGDKEDIKIFELDGLKIGALICFELRFIELWQKLQGVDILLIPAMWGKKRKENFQTLTQAIAVLNQCFVVASNSANSDMAKSSSIITPFGKVYEDDTLNKLEKKVNLKEIKMMRRYMNVGI